MFGTFVLQIAFMSVYVNKFYYEYINEERLGKLMDSLVPKSFPFVLCLRKEDLDFVTAIDETVLTAEDIIKVGEEEWVNISLYFLFINKKLEYCRELSYRKYFQNFRKFGRTDELLKRYWIKRSRQIRYNGLSKLIQIR